MSCLCSSVGTAPLPGMQRVVGSTTAFLIGVVVVHLLCVAISTLLIHVVIKKNSMYNFVVTKFCSLRLSRP